MRDNDVVQNLSCTVRKATSLSSTGLLNYHVMKTRYILLLFCMILAGCAGVQINSAISRYQAVADLVKLGDSKKKVLAILLPTQKDLPMVHSKSPDKYIKDGVEVEIYYMRSGHQGDGFTTDDEFVPYLFQEGKLVGIGWEVLGGPKTSAGKVVSVD